MNIIIEPNALNSDNADRLRPGSLFGIRRLLQMNHTIYWKSDALSPEQQELLSWDGLEPSGEEPESGAILRLDPETERLQITANEIIYAEAETWPELAERFLFPKRETTKTRKTAETDIELRVLLDGSGTSHIDTGLKFFDHMLDQIARHGLLDLDISCKGDLEVDEHHTIEDIAIVLGDAIYELCGKDKTGIQRYGFLLAMDESQADVALDLSNRPWLVWDAEFNREYVGDFPLEMAKHFFHTLAMHMKATLQIRVRGENEHHKLEAIFKGFAKALRFSITRSERAAGILPSSKEVL